MKHKHYDVIIAYANGEEIEWRVAAWDKWRRIESPHFESSHQYRIAKKRRVVGRFSFPEPETRKPRVGTPYYLAAVGDQCASSAYIWGDDEFDNRHLAAGRLYLTREDAAEHLAALEAVSLGDWQ